LTLVDEAGYVGVGEAAPLLGHSSETLDEVIDQLDGLRPWILGQRLFAPTRHLLQERIRGCHGSVRFALETAVFDLVARRRGLPLRALLSDGPSDTLPASAYVGAALDCDLVEQTCRAVATGFGTVKVKLAGTLDTYEHELDALRGLRRAVSPKVRIRLDANGAWRAAEAPTCLASLRDLCIEMVEQPVRVGELHALEVSQVPWAIDESLVDERDTVSALRRGNGCVAVVLKPAVYGLLDALALARRAREAGKGVVVTHFFDGPVGTATACELALALGERHFAAGLALHPGLGAWPAVAVQQLTNPGVVRGTTEAGHGIDTRTLNDALAVPLGRGP
jgi:L-alanine-DL-glutamate epimerase-like enolase superfamily enzyme